MIALVQLDSLRHVFDKFEDGAFGVGESAFKASPKGSLSQAKGQKGNKVFLLFLRLGTGVATSPFFICELPYFSGIRTIKYIIYLKIMEMCLII